MRITDEVKQLIAEGKTQQAIDLLQELLEGKDTEIYNQTLLLESQLKDFQKNRHLGLENLNVEINRIKNTVLVLCDDVEKLEIKANNDPKVKRENDNTLTTSLIVMGIVVIIVLAVIFYIISLN